MSRNRKGGEVLVTPKSAPAVEWTANEVLGKVPSQTTHRQLNSGKESEHRVRLQMRTTPVSWGIPMDEMMFSQFFTNLFHLNFMPWDSMITTESTYLPDARNYIHEVYLNKSAAEYLFMLDSDVLAPPGTLEKLIAHDLPIVGGFYRKKESFNVKDLEGNSTPISRPVVYDWSEEKDGKYWFNERMEAGQGLEKVDGIGAGCLLMKREVAEALGERPYSMEAGGEDLVLCKKLMDLDIPIHVDWDVAAAHVGVGYV